LQVFDDRDLENLKAVLEKGDLCSVRGEMTPKFEAAFAEKIDARYAVATNSGMSALHAAVAAADAGPGDEVICDPMVQFGAMAVFYNNAVPVFADIDPETYLIDPKSIEKRITDRTKAIICTHLWGLPCDMKEIMDIARTHHIMVIEDCAHALLAQYNSRFTGTLGHIGVFSFQMSKQLGLGDAGMATTSDSLLRERLLDGSGVRGLATFPKLMWNYRLNELVSAVGLAQLKKAAYYVEQHIEWATIYNEALAKVDCLHIQARPEDRTHSYHLWAAHFDAKERSWDPRNLDCLLAEKGVLARIGYIGKPAYLHDVFRLPLAYGKGCPLSGPFHDGDVSYQPGLCPEAERIMPNMLLVPLKWKSLEYHRENAEKLKICIDEFFK
jgi:perosamine synthetase